AALAALVPGVVEDRRLGAAIGDLALEGLDDVGLLDLLHHRLAIGADHRLAVGAGPGLLDLLGGLGDAVLGPPAVGLDALLAEIAVDVLVAARGRHARAVVPHDGGLGAGAVVVPGEELAAARADARVEVAAEQDVLVDLVRVLDV